MTSLVARGRRQCQLSCPGALCMVEPAVPEGPVMDADVSGVCAVSARCWAEERHCWPSGRLPRRPHPGSHRPTVEGQEQSPAGPRKPEDISRSHRPLSLSPQHHCLNSYLGPHDGGGVPLWSPGAAHGVCATGRLTGDVSLNRHAERPRGRAVSTALCPLYMGRFGQRLLDGGNGRDGWSGAWGGLGGAGRSPRRGPDLQGRHMVWGSGETRVDRLGG